FGVSHKERIKAMRREVDVLTLSATPIPRTLHLSLVGIRDLSVIETPPEARLPIQTRIAEDDDGLVRDAISRELDRGGQVFYVHNRVETIEAAAERVRRLVPGARVAIGHGQMAEGMLERVMLDFSEGRFDVLVSTTIIESGLDIPNANTIIIVRADTFGLAQLYQLRGRVGRSDRRAHAYLLHRRGMPLSPIARKRLHAIFSASDLGAGYQIALSDLEIRGAGNILGAEQHGFMAAVGFEMYTRMLAEAVDLLRGRRALPEPSPVRLDLPGSAYLPDDYIADSGAKLEAYRRFARLRSEADADALRVELRDRYGPIPRPVEGLFTAVRVRLAAESAGVPEVRVDEGRVTLKWSRMLDRREVGVALQTAGLRPDTASNQVRIPVATRSRPRCGRCRPSGPRRPDQSAGTKFQRDSIVAGYPRIDIVSSHRSEPDIRPSGATTKVGASSCVIGERITSAVTNWYSLSYSDEAPSHTIVPVTGNSRETCPW
ncbi:MAG TPA: TRCF domain-containing protein, partial [Vitreimonas sp.]|nr:TRCF domain-containing protein [Vitreimonas sp.]